MISNIKGIYIFLDPFDRADSGVSSYTSLAAARMQRLGISTKTIKLNKNETIVDFRNRVATDINNIRETILCIEAPESLASTANLPDSLPLHIRLHCSRSLGAAIQGLPYSEHDVAIEQTELCRAKYLSAPSWAAYFTSLCLFKFPHTPLFYPNPSPEFQYQNIKKPKYDLLFVGRLQFLKGLHYLEHLIEHLPNLSFAVACPPNSNWKFSNKKNVTVVDGTSLSKHEIYNLANIVIVPSIFETSSMVAIEALAHDCQVITWKHLGVSEYINDSRLIKVNSNILDDFLHSIKTCNPQKKPTTGIVTEVINKNFDRGISQVLSPVNLKAVLLNRPDETTELYLRNLIREQTFFMKTKKKSSFSAKTRKLILNPVAFFRDSKEAKYVRRKIHERKQRKYLKLQTELFPQGAPNDIEIRYVTKIEQSEPETLNSNAPALALYAEIQKEGRITFATLPSMPAGCSTAFFYSIGEESQLVSSILDALDSFDDFKYLNKTKLNIGTFDITADETTLSIINRIDVKNKTTFSEIDTVVLVNAPVNLCQALRAIGTNHRIVLIKSTEELVIDNQSIDALISTTDSQSMDALATTRRHIKLESEEHIPTAVRRIIQEGFPKKPDMLLSLFMNSDCGFTKEEFNQLNTNSYQGIIKTKPYSPTNSKTMTDIYKGFSESVIAIALIESVYMRYRSLCEAVENGASPENLINSCLTDGILFDVQEV